jgi:NADH-quinone oxidoreductase subunit L
VLLAVPSIFIGWMTMESILFGDWFRDVIYVAPEHNVLGHMADHYHGELAFVLHGLVTPPFWLALAGFLVAAYMFWYLFSKRPQIEQYLRIKYDWLYGILDRKYGFDELNQALFAGGGRAIGRLFWTEGDRRVIDGLIVNGSAKTVGWLAGKARFIQTGYLYHYAIAMILGLLVLLTVFVVF